jgi:hypothetical protein
MRRAWRMRGPWNGSRFGQVGREPWALRVLWMGGDARLWLRPPGGRRGRRGRRKQASCCPEFESADAADRINPYCLRLHTRAPPPTRSNPDFSIFRPSDLSTLFPASRLADSQTRLALASGIRSFVRWLPAQPCTHSHCVSYPISKYPVPTQHSTHATAPAPASRVYQHSTARPSRLAAIAAW